MLKQISVQKEVFAEEESDLTFIEGAANKIRLNHIRANIGLSGFEGATLSNYLVRSYLNWVQEDEYLILAEYDEVEGYTGNYVGVKASKRGNDVYAKRVKDRFSRLHEVPNVEFFNHKDRSKRHKTKALFTTLTFDQKDLLLSDSWTQIGINFNRFMANIRKKYGKVSLVRVWESHKSGYPHIHVILLFHEHEFNAFHYNGSWRTKEKRQIESCWSHGFSDVEALASIQGGLRYLGKYLGKVHGLPQEGIGRSESSSYGGQGSNLAKLINNASVKTLAIMWAFRKRAFSISKDLAEFIRILHNSNFEGDLGVFVQLDLEGGAPVEGVKRWILWGFWSGQILRDKKCLWSVDLDRADVDLLRSSGAWTDFNA